MIKHPHSVPGLKEAWDNSRLIIHAPYLPYIIYAEGRISDINMSFSKEAKEHISLFVSTAWLFKLMTFILGSLIAIETI
jgi:hypothetical protein